MEFRRRGPHPFGLPLGEACENRSVSTARPATALALLLPLLTGAATPPEVVARLAASINGARAAAGLAPVTLRPALSEVARERAEGALASDDLGLGQGTLYEISRALRSAGYQPARWRSKILRASGGAGAPDPEEILERWRREAPEEARELLGGDFQDLGVAVVQRGVVTVCSLLLALPRATALERQAAPLRNLAEVRRRVLAAVNERRTEAGRSPLRADPHLDTAGQSYARELVDGGYFAHVSRRGKTPEARVEAAGYGPVRLVAENLAKGLFTPEEVVERWMKSPGHRRNLLRAGVTDTGLGVAVGTDEQGEVEVVWDQLFADRR